MAATQPDQVLVQRPHLGAAMLIQLHWGRAEFGAHRVVAAESLLLDAAKAELVAGVHTGNAADRHQDHQRVGQVFGTLEAGWRCG